MEKCVETLDAPEDSHSCTDHSGAETQFLHDPNSTQFAPTQYVDWAELGSEGPYTNPTCTCTFESEGESVFDGQICVTSTKPVCELRVVEIRTRKSRFSDALRAEIQFHVDGVYTSKWEAMRVAQVTKTPMHEFVFNLSLAYVKLSEPSLRLQFLPNDKLIATLTNVLRGPIETQIMLFECVCAD